jgi:ABC-type Fe3+ transport system permease subunit
VKHKKWWLAAFIFCLVLATLSPLASSSPDGLEQILGDSQKGMTISSPASVMAGYLFPGIHNEAWATILAGWIGTTLVFVLAFGVTWLITRVRNTKSLPTAE